MKSNEIRKLFIEFFRDREHRHMSSSSLVPHNDPTVLLTTAGMQQMTPYFLGLEPAPASRMTSIQKCFRTNDIDEVGDESHLTFFEMLGNFSVGDYFKAEAISWAWELITEHFRIPVDRLYVSVHYDDEFSWEYWQREIGLPVSRIRKLGDEDNWWGPVGETGPNGPDSEIFYDRGEQYGCGEPDCGPGCDCGRFLEFWNLVFMEFYKEVDGTQSPLPSKNIDTGMGLERISSILQGTETVFETDLYMPIIQHVSDLAGVEYGRDEQATRSLRVIADHGRAVTFLILDGVFPGNEGRSYVLRRVLRRAVRHGRLLGLEGPFLGSVAEKVVEIFAEHYEDLPKELPRILRIINHEEAHFSQTLATGIARFDDLVVSLEESDQRIIPGNEAFRLYDTYGFPFELTEELARDKGFEIDREGFQSAMAKQQETSRAGASSRTGSESANIEALQEIASATPSEFVGYENELFDSVIVGLLKDAERVSSLQAGDNGAVILAKTPFYAESGGQVGDTGIISAETGNFSVEDTQRTIPNLIVHYGTVREGFLEAGSNVTATVDSDRRRRIRRNHTATHLLHAALRESLGDHARQAGSLVAPDRLRFDVTNLEPIGKDRLRDIQQRVAEQILRNQAVMSTITDYESATREGAMALFGEKYGDDVRVISINGFSKELCGGTHVDATGEIGPFVIVGESSVASGVRRVEAITGDEAIRYLTDVKDTVERLEAILHVSADQIPEQVASINERLREYERQIERLRGEIAASQVDEILRHKQEVGEVTVVAAVVDAPNRDVLLQLADRCRDRLGSGVIALGANISGQPALLAVVTTDLVEQGIHAGKIIGSIAEHVGGRGGGRPNMAQGGGNDVSGLEAAMNAVVNVVQDLHS